MDKTELINKFQSVGKIKVVKGTILNPESSGLRFVLSFTNTAGKPESPLFSLFDKKWKKVKEESRGWFTNKTGAFKLGAINTTSVQSDVWVIQLLCQDDNLKVDSVALEDCIKKMAASAKYEHASVHVSTILVKEIPELSKYLEKYAVNAGINVTYYEEAV